MNVHWSSRYSASVMPPGGGVVHRVELFVALAVVAGGLAEMAAVGAEFFVFEIFADLGRRSKSSDWSEFSLTTRARSPSE